MLQTKQPEPRHALRIWRVHAIDGTYTESVLRPHHWPARMVYDALWSDGYYSRMILRTSCDWCEDTAEYEVRDAVADDMLYACREHQRLASAYGRVRRHLCGAHDCAS